MQETSLKKGDGLGLDGYACYRNKIERRGGTAVLGRNSVEHHQLLILHNLQEMKASGIEISKTTTLRQAFLIFSVYAPPGQKDAIDEELEKIVLPSRQIFLIDPQWHSVMINGYGNRLIR